MEGILNVSGREEGRREGRREGLEGKEGGRKEDFETRDKWGKKGKNRGRE